MLNRKNADPSFDIESESRAIPARMSDMEEHNTAAKAAGESSDAAVVPIVLVMVQERLREWVCMPRPLFCLRCHDYYAMMKLLAPPPLSWVCSLCREFPSLSAMSCTEQENRLVSVAVAPSHGVALHQAAPARVSPVTTERAEKYFGMRAFGCGTELFPFLGRREARALRLMNTRMNAAVDRRAWVCAHLDTRAFGAHQYARMYCAHSWEWLSAFSHLRVVYVCVGYVFLDATACCVGWSIGAAGKI